jgi:cytoskeletal protein CcmA (bactofilin family)
MDDMFKFLLRSSLTTLGLALLAATSTLEAQLRDVVSKEVAVGRSEAALRLELSDDGALEIAFEDGLVVIDGDVVGMFEPGDQLEAAWRSLLGQAVSLDDGELAIMLSDWSVPANLANDLADLAREVDRALEDALSSFEITVSSNSSRAPVIVAGDPGSLLSLFLNATGELGLLGEALAGLRGEFAIHVDEDVVVPAGSTVDGTLVVIQGDARIEGEVDGDVIVVDGTLELLEGSRVRGEVRLADARLVRNLGTVEDGLVDLLEEERVNESEIRSKIREEVQAELRAQLRREIRDMTRLEFSDADNGFSLMAPFRSVFRGVGELVKNLISILVLGLLGAGAVAFAGTNVDTIADTARRSPGRSAMVGMAGTLLLIPVWLLGAVALTVSVIGIPVALVWLPLFPLAACAAGVMGYVVVARNTGEWLADSEYPWTGWIRKSNPIYTIFGGLFGLMLAFMAANVLSITPFLGFLTGLLAFAGSVVTFFAIQIGFGAVLLTRAGRRNEWASTYDPDAAWERAMDVDVEVDVDETADKVDEDSDDA